MNNDNEKNKYTDEKTGRFLLGNPGKPMGAISRKKKLEKDIIEIKGLLIEILAKVEKGLEK